MIHFRISRIASAVIAFVLAAAFVMPATAFAGQAEVAVENHTLAGDQSTISGLVIDDVAAPYPGDELDDTAKVTSAEGAEWEIPVLWVADDLELATEAQEGRSYLPALVFYLPQGYAIDGNEFTVTLSDSLTELFGGSEIVSVYDAQTGITYILPASLRNFFANLQQQEAENGQSGWDDPAPEPVENPSGSDLRTLVDIYCAQTARDAFSDEDLEFILDLILHKLEPQAVELLLDGFPAYRTAADQGQIGREIGLYVYYEAGDKDGIPEHMDTPSGALAYVRYDTLVDGNDVKFCYMIGVDLSTLALVDGDGNPVRDSRTGKFMLIREGESMTTLENTIVHELFHAMMYDYNRTGMVGAKDLRNVITDDEGKFPTQELKELYNAIHYPLWFIEGTASSVENIYQYRYDTFMMLRAQQGSGTVFTEFYDTDGLLYNYLNATSDNKNLYFDLEYSSGQDENGNEVDANQCNYVSGYLATLYLSELAARKTGGSAIVEDESTVAISSERLRSGLNCILERMHNGETLDQVVYDLSPVDASGKKLYADTDDFEAKFIKGVGTKTASGVTYSGDEASLEFTTTFLNYLVALENTMGQDAKPNGSILMDFDTELESPLDSTKDSYSDFLQIVESNELVESTVPNEVALAGGGTSDSGSAADSEDATKLAAKAEQEAVPAAEDEAADEVTVSQADPQAGDEDGHAESAAPDAPVPSGDNEPESGAAGDEATDEAVVGQADSQDGEENEGE